MGEDHTRERALELLEVSARAVRQRGVGVQTVIRSGDPASALLEVSDDVDADLGERVGPAIYVHVPAGGEHGVRAVDEPGCTVLYPYVRDESAPGM